MTVRLQSFVPYGALALLLAAIGPAHAAGDAAHGKQVFATCGICHSDRAGEVKFGPPLFGVVGRKAASVSGFPYSPAIRKLDDVTWTPEQIFKWLADPAKMAPGTAMSFNLPSEPDRQDVIAYLETLK